MKYLKKREIDSLSIAHLEPERQQQIMAIKNGIALNYASTLDFASSASVAKPSASLTAICQSEFN